MVSLRTSTLLLGLLVTPAAFAGSPPKPHAHLTQVKLDVGGRSVGSPTEGHLLGGAHLGDAPYLRIVPVYAAGDVRWGVEPLVSMIDHAARTVHKQFPDAVLSVGHLSRPGGGELDRHASHESGRDADIGFYVKNQASKPIFADHFVPFKADGTAISWPGAHFDDAKNWALVSTIAGDVHAHVSHIFVALPIRTRLLQYAEKIGAPPAVRTRAAELMAQPRGSLPHDDHFHVRISCPSNMDKCIEQPLARKPMHGALARAAKARAPQVGHASTPVAAAPRPAPAREESIVPSLAPMVPGLDSVVIPAPLMPVKAVSKPAPTPAPAPERDREPELVPVDDPDGVLDPR